MDETQSLSLLLAKPALRKRLAENPQALQQELHLDDATLSFLVGIDLENLESQADCLVNKRFHEVRGIIPRTIRRIGGVAREQFQTYAVESWPVSHRRHLLDADGFAQYCLEQGIDGVDPFELNRLRFRLSEKTFRLRVIQDRCLQGRRKWRLQFLCGIFGRIVDKRW